MSRLEGNGFLFKALILYFVVKVAGAIDLGTKAETNLSLLNTYMIYNLFNLIKTAFLDLILLS